MHLSSDGPIVIVTTMDVPFSVYVSSALLVVGVVFAILCAARYRRTGDRAWVVLSVGSVVLALLAVAGLVIYLSRVLW